MIFNFYRLDLVFVALIVSRPSEGIVKADAGGCRRSKADAGGVKADVRGCRRSEGGCRRM